MKRSPSPLCFFLVLAFFSTTGCAWIAAQRAPKEVVQAPDAEPFMARDGLAEAGIATNPNALNKGEDVSPAVVPNGIYSFKNVMSGLCIEFPESSLLSDPPRQMRCRNSETQHFEVSRRGGNNNYAVKSRAHERFLQNKARMGGDGGQFELSQESRDKTQNFAFDRKAEGQFVIRSLFSARVLEVTGNSPDEAAIIQQSEYEGHTHQVWQLILVGTIEGIP